MRKCYGLPFKTLCSYKSYIWRTFVVIYLKIHKLVQLPPSKKESRQDLEKYYIKMAGLEQTER